MGSEIQSRGRILSQKEKNREVEITKPRGKTTMARESQKENTTTTYEEKRKGKYTVKYESGSESSRTNPSKEEGGLSQLRKRRGDTMHMTAALRSKRRPMPESKSTGKEMERKKVMR